jgi:hypothetical protein
MAQFEDSIQSNLVTGKSLTPFHSIGLPLQLQLQLQRQDSRPASSQSTQTNYTGNTTSTTAKHMACPQTTSQISTRKEYQGADLVLQTVVIKSVQPRIRHNQTGRLGRETAYTERQEKIAYNKHTRKKEQIDAMRSPLSQRPPNSSLKAGPK